MGFSFHSLTRHVGAEGAPPPTALYRYAHAAGYDGGWGWCLCTESDGGGCKAAGNVRARRSEPGHSMVLYSLHLLTTSSRQRGRRIRGGAWARDRYNH
jgi:hypothetical protein